MKITVSFLFLLFGLYLQGQSILTIGEILKDLTILVNKLIDIKRVK